MENDHDDPFGSTFKKKVDPFDSLNSFGFYNRSFTFDAPSSNPIAFPLSLKSLSSGPLNYDFSTDGENEKTTNSEEMEPKEDYHGSNNYHLGFIPKGKVAYTFPLASRVKGTCFLKVVVNHNVAGLYIGKNGTHLKRLQSMLKFKLAQSGRDINGDFTGVGYPCHRTNTTMLFQGRLVDILMALRPLYRIIQNDLLILDEESLQFTGGRLLNVKFELSLVLPADRKRLLLQDSGKRCNHQLLFQEITSSWTIQNIPWLYQNHLPTSKSIADSYIEEA